MSKTHIKNPLPKRFKREIRSDIGKYIVIFALLVVSIGFTSGFLVAADSMIVAYDESFAKYNVEDGNFTLQNRANPAQTRAIENIDGEVPVKLYEQFYSEFELENESTLRVFANRTIVNTPCVMEGELPDEQGEIAIDRMYADNNGLSIGDEISDKNSDRSWIITGLVALPDYSALFSSNNEIMFDSMQFGVSVVSEEEFETFLLKTNRYTWKYLNGVDGTKKSIENENELSDELMKRINREVALDDFVPRYLNQAITFTGTDMGSDRAMMEVFLYIMVVITAFVYAITMKDTITKEATVIGTLLASGYTKSELVRHYMSMPLLVTLIAAIVGNILGYTAFKEVCIALYYNSYSLPTYTAHWNANAFLRTTIIPIAIMAFITWFVLRRSLSFSPMNFLKRNLTRNKNKSAVKLSKKIPFFARFRSRIILQNIPNYLVLLFGIFFANTLLFFGMALPNLLTNYQDKIVNEIISEKQYVLSIPQDVMDEDRKTESMINLAKYMKDIETENTDAEKFSAYSLNTITDNGARTDEIMIYGIVEDSKYIDVDFDDNDVYVSSLYADKFGVEVGDVITLKEQYEDDTYEFEITGILHYEGAMNIFMDIDKLNETFDLPKGIFSGYFANTEITDIPEEYIGSVIDYESLTKVSRQLMKSFGGFMKLVDAFSVLLFVFLIYLLSKIIIEKNAQSISMTKILGYTDGEVSRLYLVATSIAVIVFVLVTLPIVYVVIDLLWRFFIAFRMSGWIRYEVDNSIYIKMFSLAMASYVVVALLEFWKIRRIPMDEALKNVE